MIKAYVAKLKRENKDRLTQSWMTAYFHRVKEMPNLEDLLKDKDEEIKKKATTAETMLAKIKALNAQFGGEVVE